MFSRCLSEVTRDHRHAVPEMLCLLLRGELVGQLASFGGQPAAGSFFRVVELLLRDALRLFHNKPNLPFPKVVVNSGGATAVVDSR